MAGRISTEDNTVRKLELPLQYLKDITDNFSSEREIGRGGFGVVYKGMEPQSEVVIAVKKLKPILGGQDKQFKNEVNHLARLSHDNIVKLVGYCDETKERPVYDEYQQKYILAEVQDKLLCYEYMSKGSLDKYIFDESIGLDWQDRYKIINGICQGLYCLHEGLDNTPIIHMDLKPCNILLDDRMEPKIADFGLSRFFSEEQTRTCTMNVIGSIGYMAPEYLHRGEISTKSDIYSLGILILEVVTGEKNSHVAGNRSGEYFIENVRKNWTEMSQIVLKYPSLGTDCHHQVHRCIETGLRCAEANPETRPSAGQILSHIFSGKSTSADKVDQSLGESEVSQWNVLQFNTGTTAPFIIKCGANSSSELVIKADLRVQEPKGGEVIRVVPRPTVLADLSFEEIKGVFEQLPEAVSLLALERTAYGTRARYSRLYRTLASKVTALKEIVAEMERGGVPKDALHRTLFARKMTALKVAEMKRGDVFKDVRSS